MDKCSKLERQIKNEESKLEKSGVKRNREEWYLYLKEKGLTKCKICGYDKCFAAIEFHHKNPAEKKSIMGFMMNQRITIKAIEELEKTIPLCANCHREMHHMLK